MLLRFFAVAFLIPLIGTSLDAPSRANSQTTYGYTCVSYVPAEWGEFKGGNQQSGLAFQDRAGTLRFVQSSLRLNATTGLGDSQDGADAKLIKIRASTTLRRPDGAAMIPFTFFGPFPFPEISCTSPLLSTASYCLARYWFFPLSPQRPKRPTSTARGCSAPTRNPKANRRPGSSQFPPAPNQSTSRILGTSASTTTTKVSPGI